MTSTLRGARVALAATAAVAAASWTLLAAMGATPAHAVGPTARVSVSPTTLNASGATTLTLSGSGFQSLQGGFGGIYVVFGIVEGQWEPSLTNGGGRYLYVLDSQTAENQGRTKFVAFPGSSTSGEANGGTISANGSWQTTLNVPGPVIAVGDASGATRQVDCRVTTCGVITIGAHGVKNGSNETFKPVSVRAAQTPTAVAPKTTPPVAQPTKAATGTTSTPSATVTATSATPIPTAPTSDDSVSIAASTSSSAQGNNPSNAAAVGNADSNSSSSAPWWIAVGSVLGLGALGGGGWWLRKKALLGNGAR